MKWSLRIARIAGIDIFLHWTFIILLIWIGLSLLAPIQQSQPFGQFWFILLLFFFVLLHELGHALVGQRFGVKTSSITLLPIGGVANMERMPEKPWQEFWIAIAGPLVNLFLALVIGGILFVDGGLASLPFRPASPVSDNLWVNLLSVNLMLFGFNLIPAFPMDGGRILRALLALKFDRAKATTIAARIGQVLAMGFIFLGLFSNIWLMFIGIFIYLGAGAEASYEDTHSTLSKYIVRDALMHQHTILEGSQTIADAISQLLDGQEKEFLVADAGAIIGTLTRDDLIAGINTIGMDGQLDRIINRNVLALDPNLPLEEVFLRMSAQKLEICPVYENQQLIGVLNRENIIELAMIANARKKSQAFHP